jgi:hypothetical protein
MHKKDYWHRDIKKTENQLNKKIKKTTKKTKPNQ